MFLKRLELHGFKSFADKTELAFVPGITAVVGPNGSGKSNISDSVRWVLGEQSAKSLRGGNMADIIFAGSAARKPVNFGEVSLTLDNSDQRLPVAYDEVTVTRRIHRSGESEYFINRQACRLRDIMELFMDTGVGKEAYSIIGQGRIEEILSTRSEDRRGIFEEASGIVKYKTRKKESQKKLDETENNLIRINDLVVELETQIEPLRDQSEKAAIYKRLKEELKNSEISLYVHQITEVHKTWKEQNELLTQIKDHEIELSTIVSAHDAHLETDRFAARKLEEEIDVLQTQLMEMSAESEKTEVSREVLVERRRNLIANKENLDQSQEAAESKKQQLLEEQVDLQVRISQVEKQREDLAATIAEQEALLARLIEAASEEHEANLQAELLAVISRLATVRNDVRFVDSQRSVQMERSEKLGSDQETLAKQFRELEKEVKQAAEKLQTIGNQVTEAHQAYLTAGDSLKEKQQFIRYFAQFTGQKKEQIERDMERDYWMNADEAKDYGIVDEILEYNSTSSKKTWKPIMA